MRLRLPLPLPLQLPGRASASGEGTTKAPRGLAGLRPGQLDPSSPLLQPRTHQPKDQVRPPPRAAHEPLGCRVLRV